MLNKAGIYKIVNRINGHTYYGSTLNSFQERWEHHRKRLKKNCHENKHLQSDYNFYGINVFEFSIVLIIEEPIYNPTLKEEILMYEQMCLDLYWDNCKNCYNINFIATKPPSPKGKKRSKETIAKISGINNPFYGKKHSEETRQKISLANKNKKLSEEHKKKLSIAFSGEKHPLYGKHHSEEAKLKISLSKKGKKLLKNRLLNRSQVIEIKNMLKNSIKIQHIAKKFGVSRRTIGRIKKGEVYND